MKQSLRRFITPLIVLSIFLPVILFAQQGATIQGKVTDNKTGEGIPGANVFIKELAAGGVTDVNGAYSFVIPGDKFTDEEVVLSVRYIGYREKLEKFVVKAGTTTKDFILIEDPLGMQEVIVTGVVGGTFKEKLAFSVDRINKTALEHVPATTAEQAIRGKVAGVHIVKGSGQPGTGSNVQIRGAKSINIGTTPLYIVDGVIIENGTVNLDATNIENIEVVKGAAGSSLYGSRAQNGVIQISTNRGSSLPSGSTRINFRNEYGFNQLEHKLPLSTQHNYLYDPSRPDSPWVNYLGAHISRAGRVADTTWRGLVFNPTFKDKPYAGKQYDQIDEFFNPGDYYENLLSISHRALNTNFFVSVTNRRESGIIENHWGFGSQSFRLNIDHTFIKGVDLSFSGLHMSSKRANIASNPLFTLTFMPPDVDLRSPNPDGDPYIVQPEPQMNEANPLYMINNLVNEDKTKRTLGNLTLRYRPMDYFDIEANMSYDRSDFFNMSYTRKGYKTVNPIGVSTGSMSTFDSGNEAMNGNFTASFDNMFGDFSVRAKARYLFETTKYREESGSGAKFAVGNLSTLNLTQESKNVGSYTDKVNADGYFGIIGVDYQGKYITDFVLRNDGSSLFGAEDRRHWYYRASLAYRLSQEPWWPWAEDINEFKLRYSIGTAGARPGFSWQYETWSASGGAVSRGALGNKLLKPENSTEQEVGMEISVSNKVLLDLTYATTKTENMILSVPLVAYQGYGSQWNNAGTLKSTSLEASVKAFLLQSGNTSLSVQFNIDKFTQKIVEFNRPAMRTGGVQTTNPFYYRTGEILGSFYGMKFATSVDDLPGPAKAYADQFQVNDDGWLVFVGKGNSWQDGFAKKLWGGRDTVKTGKYMYWAKTGNLVYQWGMPVKVQDPDSNMGDLVYLGNTVPDFSAAFSSTFRWGNFTAYLLFDAQIGGKIYNTTRQWAYRNFASADNDQIGKSNETKKPNQYYSVLYATNSVASPFVEDGSYMKVRELSIRYAFDRSELAPYFGDWVSRITVGVIGRNLLTVTNYKSYDPEVGSVTQRFDGHGYPNYRQFNGVLEIEF
ncbi:MAG: SusC/RagA family TonB-linked outer membrane protein [bacterium]